MVKILRINISSVTWIPQRLQFSIFRQSPVEISWLASPIHLASRWEFASPRVVLITGLCLPLPVKVNNCDSGYSCSSPMWTLFMWGQGVVLKPGRWRQGEVGGKVNWLGRYFCLIRAITQCHNYQCHQLVDNEFLLLRGTD